MTDRQDIVALSRNEAVERCARLHFDELERLSPDGREWDGLGIEREFFIAAMERVLADIGYLNNEVKTIAKRNIK